MLQRKIKDFDSKLLPRIKLILRIVSRDSLFFLADVPVTIFVLEFCLFVQFNKSILGSKRHKIRLKERNSKGLSLREVKKRLEI